MTYLSLDLYANRSRFLNLTVDGYPVDMVRLKIIDWTSWERELLDDTPLRSTAGNAVQILFCWFRDRLKQHNDDLLSESITKIATFDIVYPISLEGLIDKSDIGNFEQVDRENYRYVNSQNITKAETFVPLEREHFGSTNRMVTIAERTLKSLLDDCEKVLADPGQAFFLFSGDGKAQEIAKIINKNHVVEMCNFTQPRLTKLLEDTFPFDHFFISSNIIPDQDPGL